MKKINLLVFAISMALIGGLAIIIQGVQNLLNV